MYTTEVSAICPNRLCQTGSRQGGIQESYEELEELATALSSDEKQSW